MKNSVMRVGAALAALGGACLSTAGAQHVDEVTAPNAPGRVYVRMLLEDDNAPTFRLLPGVPVDSSYVARDAGIDLYHVSIIPHIYGFDPDAVGDAVVNTTSNILGTQIWGRYRNQTLTNGLEIAQLTVTLPCRSAGRRSVFEQGVVNPTSLLGRAIQQGYYDQPPEGISHAAYDNIDGIYANPYAVTFTGADEDEVFSRYEQFLDADSTQGQWTYGANPDGTPNSFTSTDLLQAAYGCSVSGAGVNPLVGNAQSLQHQMIESALDFTQPSLTPDEAPWGIGMRIGRINRQGAVGTSYEARISRSFRLAEGSRALLIFDVPVSYEDVKGVRTLRASAAVAARVPVSRIWSVEPRVAYGYVYAHDQQLKGQMLTGTVSSLLYLDNLVGRGALTIGNMAGFTKVLKAQLYDYDVGNRTDNFVLRNGLAYELPLAGRGVGQRQTSLRASYALTNYFGDDLYTDTLHEATLSLGVRTRESDIRNSFEVVRVGLIAKKGEHYKSGHIFIGYRF
ncbi:hypothetical protein [Sphingobium ummariense]